MRGRIAITKYMNENITDHVETLTGEVNQTTLAEDACQHFNDYINEDEIPDEYFEYAIEAADRYEIKTGVKQGLVSGLSGLIDSLSSDHM